MPRRGFSTARMTLLFMGLDYENVDVRTQKLPGSQSVIDSSVIWRSAIPNCALNKVWEYRERHVLWIA